jgi:heat shock protein HslJ
MWLCRSDAAWLRLFAGAAAIVLSATAFAAEFPFERELLLEAKPLPGSKRVPMLEITRDGRAVIDLWCRSGEGRVKLEDDMIEFTLGPMREEGCTPERTQRDDTLAATLEKVTSWRMEDDVLVLIGPTELRYTLSSH